MKKNLFTVAAVALVALVSCNKETNRSLQPAPVSDIKFEAEMVQTKTAIGDADDEGNRAVTWELGDQVNINGTLFTANGIKEDGKAIFETDNLDFATAEQYDAVYPATAGTSLEAVTIPAAQDGTFANAAIAVAQSENRSLAFMNVASIIKFQVPAAYASVTVESTANLAGTVSVSFDENGTPVIVEVTNASNVITLNDVKADVDYYVAILPGDHMFTFNIDGRLSKEASTTLTATRAGILALGVLPKPAKLDRNLAFSAATATAKVGVAFTAPTLSGVKDGVTYTSSNPAVATVNASTGAVTAIAEGTTTITASAEATEEYAAGSASYELSVEYLLTDWNLKGTFGVINMEKSTVYTDLYVAKNVTLNSTNKFVFVNKDKSKTVGAYGSSTASVDVNGQINTWYGSEAAATHAANIYVSTAAQYDVYFSPTNLDFLIIKTGVEEGTSSWKMVGWFGSESSNQDKWSYANGISLKYNYVLCAHTLTRKLTTSDYFLFVEDSSWSGWIGSPGYERDSNNNRNTTNYTIASGKTQEITDLHHSWGDQKAQFHMNNTGTYQIAINVGNKYEAVTVKFTRTN